MLESDLKLKKEYDTCHRRDARSIVKLQGENKADTVQSILYEIFTEKQQSVFLIRQIIMY